MKTFRIIYNEAAPARARFAVAEVEGTGPAGRIVVENLADVKQAERIAREHIRDAAVAGEAAQLLPGIKHVRQIVRPKEGNAK